MVPEIKLTLTAKLPVNNLQFWTQETLIVATNYSLILLQFLFQFYVFRVHRT